MATSLKQSLELPECGDPIGKLVPSVSSNTPSQVSADGYGCLDMTESSGDLSLTGLCVSPPSSIYEGLLTMSGERECCTTRGPSLPEITVQAQGFENLRFDGSATQAHFLIIEGSPSLDKIHETASNSRAGKDGCSGQVEVGENVFSLSDQSRDSDNFSTSSLTDSVIYNSFIAPTTFTMGESVANCREGVTEDDLFKVNPDKAKEDKKEKEKICK
ncbi:hypothetical protein NDU88_010241 [Pleurodeles waltl]|uniref:Uncharacterized protein n=1 Tax=Pleurodeles waltl TaxID=8319 RepID=A0AAV7PV02_PLEWA|nr:hypothetical protein NDU88_010241 [Pleurodeles waltl]